MGRSLASGSRRVLFHGHGRMRAVVRPSLAGPEIPPTTLLSTPTGPTLSLSQQPALISRMIVSRRKVGGMLDRVVAWTVQDHGSRSPGGAAQRPGDEQRDRDRQECDRQGHPERDPLGSFPVLDSMIQASPRPIHPETPQIVDDREPDSVQDKLSLAGLTRGSRFRREVATTTLDRLVMLEFMTTGSKSSRGGPR